MTEKLENKIITESDIETFKIKYDYIKNRFPNAKFVISCFNTIEEVETKILTNEDVIIYKDYYTIHKKQNNKWKLEKEYHDYFIIRKRPDKEHIYYCDVIDELIKNNFDRSDGDHKYLETIRTNPDMKRNNKSIPVYRSFWGS